MDPATSSFYTSNTTPPDLPALVSSSGDDSPSCSDDDGSDFGTRTQSMANLQIFNETISSFDGPIRIDGTHKSAVASLPAVAPRLPLWAYRRPPSSVFVAVELALRAYTIPRPKGLAYLTDAQPKSDADSVADPPG